MKKIITLFVGVVFWVSGLVYAQSSIYHPFPDSNAVWTCEYTNGTLMCPYQEIWKYEITGDTVFGIQTYHKISVTDNYITQACIPVQTATHPIAYSGCFRQDTVSKKVYFVPPGDTLERLLYDFNLQLGDTVMSNYVTFGCNVVGGIVQTIDTVLVGTSYRKRWSVWNPVTLFDGFYLVEGVGYEAGPLEGWCYGLDAPHWGLICFEQENIPLYPNPAFYCDFPTSTFDIESLNPLSFYPNPATGELRIKNEELRIEKIEIYDVLGKKHLSQRESTLDVSSLARGIYFIKVKTESGESAAKFVKQ